MGTNCACLVVDLFLVSYERYFMMLSFSDDKQTDIIDALNTTLRYLDDILNINNIYFCQYGKSNIPCRASINKPIPLVLKPCFWICICPF